MLAVGPLLAQVRLPEPVQQRLREPRHQRSARLRGGPEEGLPQRRLEEVLPVQLGVSKIRVGVTVRELEARQLPGQMRQSRQVQHELGYRCRFAMPAQRVFQAVGLRGDVVDHEDRCGLGVVGRRPAAILLVGPALVDRRLDRAAGARQRHELRVDPDTVVERVVGTALQQRVESNRAVHAVRTSGMSAIVHGSPAAGGPVSGVSHGRLSLRGRLTPVPPYRSCRTVASPRR